MIYSSSYMMEFNQTVPHSFSLPSNVVMISPPVLFSFKLIYIGFHMLELRPFINFVVLYINGGHSTPVFPENWKPIHFCHKIIQYMIDWVLFNIKWAEFKLILNQVYMWPKFSLLQLQKIEEMMYMIGKKLPSN